MAPLRPLRLAAVAEAITLLVLIGIAVPLKHLAGLPAAVMGPVHGTAFLAFLWLLARSCAAGELPWRASGRLLLGAMLPFGGLVNERWLSRRQAGS
ncbi:DUF3817 domain-containing protein [Marinibaculum pumilum]|uniref:DUF3817 domain-containing protein n=1 Tax=Marinibaculum pumilum TaxID=1766165 RepID=A0ABV7KZB5_9PROT